MADLPMLNELEVGPGDFVYTPRSYQSLLAVLPYVSMQITFVEQPAVEKNILSHIVAAIQAGEEAFSKPFGGWRPKSNEFGMNTLRPNQIDYTRLRGAGITNEWIWTSGAVASLLAAFEDWVGAFNLPVNREIMIYAFFNNELIPNTMQIQGLMGNERLPVQDVQALEYREEQYILLPNVHIIVPESLLHIQASTKALNRAEKQGLTGYCFGNNSEIIATA